MCCAVMKHLRKEEGKLRKHEWEGEDHPEIDNEERSHEPDQASHAPFLRLLSFCPALGLVWSRLDPHVCWQGFWHHEDCQQRSRQRDEEDGVATNAARPGSHWRAEEEHPQTKGPFHQRQRLRSQPQSLQALREDGKDHGKSGHHQGDAADQERQSGGDRSRLLSRGSRNGSCSHYILQRDGDGFLFEDRCLHLSYPFLMEK